MSISILNINNKEIRIIKSYWIDIWSWKKNNWDENSLEGIYSRLEQSEESADLKSGQLKLVSLRSRKKNEEKGTEPKKLWKTIMYQHLHHEDPRKRKESKRILEGINGNSLFFWHTPSLLEDTNPHIQEAQRTPSRINSKDLYIRWTEIKLS